MNFVYKRSDIAGVVLGVGKGRGAGANKIFRKMAMRRFLFLWSMTLAGLAFSQAPNTQGVGLKRGVSASPDVALAGNVTRKQEEKEPTAPVFQYDQFRLDVELQVASKRREQIAGLRRIIQLGVDEKEMPDLLFRLGGLYWEESRYYFIEASRKDEELVGAMDRQDRGAQARILAEKRGLLDKQVEHAQLANRQYADVVQRYKNYPRNDEVLFYLGHNSFTLGETNKGLVAYRKLIQEHPKSRFVPDAHIALGQHYFNNSRGKMDMLKKALESFQQAAAFPDNQAYAYALYMQGWCHYNMGEFTKAKEQFKAVVLYGELAGKKAVEGEKGRPDARTGLIREARNDFVRAYARGGGTPGEAKVEFARVSNSEDERFDMLKRLANFYYQEGRDREAAVAFDMLIQERPLSPEAPGFQGKIVDCVMRAGNKPMTVAQVRRLVQIMTQIEASGTIKEAKDRIALSEAKDLAERTISNLAVNWHKEGSKTRDRKTFEFSNEVYSDYLTLFPDSSKAYELRFFWAELLYDQLEDYAKAAEQYGMVADEDARRIESQQAPGKRLEDAAYNAVFAYNELLTKARERGASKAAPSASSKASRESPLKPREMSEEHKRLLTACERYLKYVPSGKSRVEVAYIAAKIYYDHEHLEEAIVRFIAIAENHPNHRFATGKTAGELSAHLALDSYDQLQQWENLHQTAVRFYRNEQLAKGELKQELEKIVENSAFKLIELLEKKGQHDKAAEAYIAFAKDFPDSQLADQALFNASLGYAKAKQINKAIETRQFLIRRYPKSPYYPETLYLLSQDFVMVADFESAATHFEQYVSQYRIQFPSPKGAGAKPVRTSGQPDRTAARPEVAAFDFKDEKAQLALINAVSFRSGLGQSDKAIKNGETYLVMWPNAKDTEEVFWIIIQNMEKLGRGRQAISMLEEYAEKKRRSSPNAYATAQAKIFVIARNANMRSIAKRASDELKAKPLPKKNMDELGAEAKENLALAFYDAAEEEFRHYQRLRIRWAALNNAAQFQETVKAKELSLGGLLKAYTAIVTIGSPGYAICASSRLGDAYADMAQNFLELPAPRGMQADVEADFQGLLQERALPFSKEAVAYYQASVVAARENNLSNNCSENALTRLRNNYRIPGFEPRRDLLVSLDVKQHIQPSALVTQISAPETQLAQEQVRRLMSAIDSPTRASPQVSPQATMPARGAAPASQSLKESDDEPL